MTLDSLIMFSGAFVATLPFLGLPNSWDDKLFLVAGVLIIALGIVVRRRERSGPADVQSDHFVEHIPRSQANVHVEP